MSWLGWILRKLKPTTIFIRLLFASSISKMDKVELRLILDKKALSPFPLVDNSSFTADFDRCG
jgi:hypothetical protein